MYMYMIATMYSKEKEEEKERERERERERACGRYLKDEKVRVLATLAGLQSGYTSLAFQ